MTTTLHIFTDNQQAGQVPNIGHIGEELKGALTETIKIKLNAM